MDADIVIAGAGLAGACAALALADSHRVAILDDGQPGASDAAAGLVNPFMGRKAKRAWRATDALAALASVVNEIGRPEVFQQTGLLRPARDARQSEAFQARAAEFPDALGWRSPEASAERWPEVRAPHGALWVREGGHVEIPRLVEALLAEAQRRGAEIVRARLVGWDGSRAQIHRQPPPSPTTSPFPLGEGQGEGAVHGREATDEIHTTRLLLCTGDGTRALAPDLLLHRVKGQTVRLAAPPGLTLPPVSGPVYVVPVSPDEVIVGATFEHDFDTLAPTPEAAHDLRQRAAAMVPALEGAEILEARAGVRLTVPASVRPGRLPLLGPLAKHPGVWAFTGLGAKGLLTAPLLARPLAGWWDESASIWPEVSTLLLAKNE